MSCDIESHFTPLCIQQVTEAALADLDLHHGLLSLMIGVRESYGSSGAKAQVECPIIKENAIEIP